MSELIEKIYRYDSIISYRLGDLRSYNGLTTLMIFASRLGDGPVWTISSLILFVLGGPTGRHAAMLVAASTMLCVGIFKALKKATSRKRPFETYPDLLIEYSLPPPDAFSFPSGHSMNAFAIAVIMGYYFPFMMLPLLALAFLIAASRVFLALHYPTDCFAGAFVGVLVARGLIFFAG